MARPTRQAKGVHMHDEWDHRIDDYRVGWCHVHDLELEGDSGSFFTTSLAQHRELLPEVRRQFQKVKPEGYRILRGLLDGEDFDLNAVVDARADLRARHDTSSKLYTARKREERDVATLFLLDMSASTDEETEPPQPAADREFDLEVRTPPAKRRRIIDIQKEALVIMSQALEEIGDLYAIYGFSGHGRKQVELFSVKSFDESLTMAVRGRIGGIEPQRSTRMGAALRQALTYFRPIAARSKHLILLSDGFPQDFDYGDDRRSNVYGLKDTAMALREAQQGGISTFCITVDRAGNDYLREMCEEKRYLVIDEIDALPLELPKIYSEATRGG
jgi:nitric oxide reductase activation protein